MVLHVRDAKTDALVRELARRRGIGLTEAIREAVQEALLAGESKVGIWDRTAEVREAIGRYPVTGAAADKQFFDELSGQGGD
jgi:antitoxin VapB